MPQLPPFIFPLKTSSWKLSALFLKFLNPNNEQPTTNNQTPQRYKLVGLFLLWILASQNGQAQTQPSLPTLVPVNAPSQPQKPKPAVQKVTIRLRTSVADKEILKKYKLRRGNP